jgi:hypothetical protein
MSWASGDDRAADPSHRPSEPAAAKRIGFPLRDADVRLVPVEKRGQA